MVFFKRKSRIRRLLGWCSRVSGTVRSWFRRIRL